MLMDLFIETLTGVSFELRVSPTETVMSIKSKIQRAEGIPVTQQHLIWQNDELDDHRRLRDYSISGGSTLRLVLGLRGGPLNAHRIPPLRLTPIQLTSSAAPLISKISRVSADRSKRTQMSRLTLPALSTQGVRPQSLHTRTANSIKSTADEITESVKVAAILPSAGSEHAHTPSEVDKAKTDSETSTSLLLTSFSRLTTSDGVKSVPSVSNPASVSQETLSDPSTTERADTSKLLSADLIRGQNSSDRVHSDIPTDKSSLLGSISQELTSDSHDSSPKSNSVVPLTSLRPSTVRSNVDNSNCNTSSSAPGDVVPSGDQATSAKRSTRLSSSPLGYPPLINPTGHFRSTLNSCDLSSYWRLYEPRELTAVSQSTMLRNRFPFVGMTDPNNDSSSSSAPGSDRDSPPTTFNLVPPTSDSTNANDGRLEDFSFSSPDVSTAATILSGLLSVSGDHLALPCQTSGSEREFGRARYPYHWLRQRASPLLEEATEEVSHTNSCLWDASGTEDDCEAVAQAALFKITIGRDDEDGEGEDEGELDDDDDDDDVDSVGTKGAYTCGLDDDDSLADLEDYLFYYRTGDLLFGPPIASVYPPYSYHYNGQDCFAVDNWRAGLEADFGISSTRERRKDATSKQQHGSAWHQECTQLAEKVQDLKARMKEARVRRQSRQRQPGKDRDQSSSGKPEASPTRKTEIKDHSSSSIPVTSENPQTSADTGSSNAANATDLRTNSHTSASCHEPKPRQRRFGTVTPPELSFLVQTQLDTSSSESKRHSPDHANSVTVQESTSLSNQTGTVTGPSDELALSSPLIAARPTFSSPNDPDKSRVDDLADSATSTCKDRSSPVYQLAPTLTTTGSKPPVSSKSLPSPQPLPQRSKNLFTQPIQFLPNLTGIPASPSSSCSTRLLSAGEGRARVCSRLSSGGGGSSGGGKAGTGKAEGQTVLLRPLATPPTPGKGDTPHSPPKPTHSPNGLRRKRCALCLRKIGIVNSYSCRCGRNFCSRHRYAEVHACPFDYKAEARRTLIDSNPVVTAPKLPKI